MGDFLRNIRKIASPFSLINDARRFWVLSIEEIFIKYENPYSHCHVETAELIKMNAKKLLNIFKIFL